MRITPAEACQSIVVVAARRSASRWQRRSGEKVAVGVESAAHGVHDRAGGRRKDTSGFNRVIEQLASGARSCQGVSRKRGV